MYEVNRSLDSLPHPSTYEVLNLNAVALEQPEIVVTLRLRL